MRRSFVLILCLCSCSDIGLGVPGAGTPLPAGGLPPSQTLEGGAQIQLSAAGMSKVHANVLATLDAGVSQGFCVGHQSILGSDFCYTNQGSCSPGCFFAVEVPPTGIQTSVVSSNTVNVQLTASASGSVPIEVQLFPGAPPGRCTATITFDLSIDADVGLSIDPATGSLVAAVDQLNGFGPSNVQYSNCSIIPDLGSTFADFLDAVAQQFLLDSFLPAVNAAIEEHLPSPRELTASIDLPALALTGAAASNGSAVETRIVPGGYVQLANGGLSLGVVTGFNSDAEPATRAPGLASEPDPCVAGLLAPDLALPPFSLPTTARGSFLLSPADAFLGMPMPTNDILIGVSRSALDLAGHHLVASGGLCLTLGLDRAAVLRRDVLDDLLGVPLADADAELRLVVRPQQAIHFSVGAGTAESPHLGVALDGLEIDVDTMAAGIPTPALTLGADVALGLQLATRHDAGQPVRLETTRSSLTVANPAVAVFDSRYAALGAAQRDALAGTIADVVWSLLGADAGTYLVPGVGGSFADHVTVGSAATSTDEFLTVGADFSIAPTLDPPAPTPQPSSVTLALPTPAQLRAALVANDDAGLPAVHVTLPASDGVRPLEHAWRTDGGAWRPYEATGELVVRDRSFAWQGERTIELRSRVVGDDGTTSPTSAIDVVIDWAPPTIFADQASFATHLVVPARDAVSSALEWAIGRVAETEPATAWTADPNLDAATALSLGDDVVVYVRDDAGNVARSAPIQLVPEPGAVLSAAIACAALSLVSRRKHGRRGSGA